MLKPIGDTSILQPLEIAQGEDKTWRYALLFGDGQPIPIGAFTFIMDVFAADGSLLASLTYEATGANAGEYEFTMARAVSGGIEPDIYRYHQYVSANGSSTRLYHGQFRVFRGKPS